LAFIFFRAIVTPHGHRLGGLFIQEKDMAILDLDPQVRAALEQAARDAGIIDSELVALPIWKNIIQGIESLDASALAKGAEAAVESMAKFRPQFFGKKDYSAMDLATFEAEEEKIREKSRAKAEPVLKNEF
jgi:hypothetical protein